MLNIYDSEQYRILQELESRELAENSFLEFVKQAWPILEGDDTPFVPGMHITVMCEHLEALVEGTVPDFRNIIFNVPPRSSKSTIISVLLCPWVWIKRPHERFLCASHSNDLSIESSTRCRRVIENDWYQKRWGDRFHLVGDQNTKGKFENNKTGYRIATSTGARTIGKGGTYLILDDPNDTNESDVERENTNRWLDQTWSSRVNDRKTSKKIVVQQRSHEIDVSGYTLKNDKDNKWVSVVLPLEFEVARKCRTIPIKSSNGIPWEDPRTKEGQLLWPERWGKKEIKEMKSDLKSQYAIAGQLQQRPTPEHGGMIKKTYFKWWKHSKPPAMQQIVQSWDTALSDNKEKANKQNCYSVCTTWGIFQDNTGIFNIILLSLYRGLLEYPELRNMAQRLYKDYRDDNPKNPIKSDGNHIPDLVLIESKSSGSTLIQELHRAGIPVTGFLPDKHGDKKNRVRLITHILERGQVWVPAMPPDFVRLRSFADILVEQCSLFPNGESRDVVDSMTQVLLRLDKDFWFTNPKFDLDVQQDTRVHAPSQPFY